MALNGYLPPTKQSRSQVKSLNICKHWGENKPEGLSAIRPLQILVQLSSA